MNGLATEIDCHRRPNELDPAHLRLASKLQALASIGELPKSSVEIFKILQQTDGLTAVRSWRYKFSVFRSLY